MLRRSVAVHVCVKSVLVDEIDSRPATLVARAKCAERRGGLEPFKLVTICGNDAVFNLLAGRNTPTTAFRFFIPIKKAQNIGTVFIENLEPRRIGERGSFYSAGLETIRI